MSKPVKLKILLSLISTRTFTFEKFYELNHEFYKDKDICRMLKLLCKSKLCFLNSDGEIYYIGDFVDVKGNSCSNNYFTCYTKRRNSFHYLSR